ncbi:MAG TPA: T9SS type A sorting domain-containing protein [Saprospiraceae bacterium]|nr:T9SS type A sorting domain-containing protein [Saprospiraceae bacterium]
MKEQLTIYLLLLTFALQAQQQDYFIKKYTFRHLNQDIGLPDLAFHNGELVARVNLVPNQANVFFGSCIWSFDEDYNISDTTLLSSSIFSEGIYIEDHLLSIGIGNPSTDYTTFDMIQIKNYNSPQEEMKRISLKQDDFNQVDSRGLFKIHDEYYMYGRTSDTLPSPHNASFLMKWNKDLSATVWTKKIDRNYDYQYIARAMPTPDDNIVYLLHGSYVGRPDPGEKANNYFIYKVDTSGQVLAQKHIPDDSRVASSFAPNTPKFILAHSSGKFYIGVSTDFDDRRNSNKRGNIVQLDEEFNREWSTMIPPHPIFREGDTLPIGAFQTRRNINVIEEARNGDILVGGTTIDVRNTIENDSFIGFTSAYLSRIDHETGEVLWVRNFLFPRDQIRNEVQPYTTSWIDNIVEDETGDLYAIGNDLKSEYDADSTFKTYQDAFLIKVNAHGCLGGEDCIDDLVVNNVEEIPVPPRLAYLPPFPNPVENTLNFEHIPHESYVLYDASGRQVKSGRMEGQFNMSAMQRGLYILDLITKQGQHLSYKIVKP